MKGTRITNLKNCKMLNSILNTFGYMQLHRHRGCWCQQDSFLVPSHTPLMTETFTESENRKFWFFSLYALEVYSWANTCTTVDCFQGNPVSEGWGFSATSLLTKEQKKEQGKNRLPICHMHKNMDDKCGRQPIFLKLSLQRSPQIILKCADRQATGCTQKLTAILTKTSTFISQT